MLVGTGVAGLGGAAVPLVGSTVAARLATALGVWTDGDAVADPTATVVGGTAEGVGDPAADPLAAGLDGWSVGPLQPLSSAMAATVHVNSFIAVPSPMRPLRPILRPGARRHEPQFSQVRGGCLRVTPDNPEKN